AVCCGADARSQMEAEAEVALLLHPGLAGVETHADAELGAVGPLVRGERALRLRRRGHPVAGAAEDDEEGVALGAHLLPAVLGERSAHELTVLGQSLRILV